MLTQAVSSSYLSIQPLENWLPTLVVLLPPLQLSTCGSLASISGSIILNWRFLKSCWCSSGWIKLRINFERAWTQPSSESLNPTVFWKKTNSIQANNIQRIKILFYNVQINVLTLIHLTGQLSIKSKDIHQPIDVCNRNIYKSASMYCNTTVLKIT